MGSKQMCKIYEMFFLLQFCFCFWVFPMKNQTINVKAPTSNKDNLILKLLSNYRVKRKREFVRFSLNSYFFFLVLRSFWFPAYLIKEIPCIFHFTEHYARNLVNFIACSKIYRILWISRILIEFASSTYMCSAYLYECTLIDL